MKAAAINSTRRMVWTALMGASGALLMFLDFSLPVFPGFLKMDLSDLPPLIVSFAWGPAAGMGAELVKNLIHSLATSTAWVGELANFITGSAFVIPAGIIYRRRHTKKGAMAGLAAGTAIMTVTAALANYWILLPFYSKIVPLEKFIAMSSAVIPAIKDTATLVLYGVAPFNLFKGAVVSLAALKLYKRINPFLNRT
ncbi:MAG: ECF transporter S component [Synergistaceae bacterium]|nr:ECF transporter S component [Synergistaceae bacterium]